MDYMCIRTKKVKQLEDVAKLSSVQLVECDEYIRLAMCVEQYVSNPSDTHFDNLKDQLANCTNHFPKFNQSRQALIANLLNIGYMVKDTPKKEAEPPSDESVEPIQYKNNVVNLFPKK